MRAIYKCGACGERMKLSAGSVYCPACGGKVRAVVSPIGRAKRAFKNVCTTLCGVWGVMLWRTLECEAGAFEVFFCVLMLCACLLGGGLVKIKIKHVQRMKAKKA